MVCCVLNLMQSYDIFFDYHKFAVNFSRHSHIKRHLNITNQQLPKYLRLQKQKRLKEQKRNHFRFSPSIIDKILLLFVIFDTQQESYLLVHHNLRGCHHTLSVFAAKKTRQHGSLTSGDSGLVWVLSADALGLSCR